MRKLDGLSSWIVSWASIMGALAAMVSCQFDTGGLLWPGFCGNGVVEGQEACDGADFRGETCESLGMSPGALSCTSTCTLDTSGCAVTPGCGDGVRQAEEQCDGADLGGATCGSLGLGSGSLGCTGGCTYDTSGCAVQPVCGNGQVEGSEQCDDGNTQACDGCSATCQRETCGNGRPECDEQCDDGNVLAGDGCDPDCVIEIPASCGDGNQDAGEECDDGNNDPCDGCSASCLLEGCGNGRQECGEECDDGDNDACDGCSATCQVESCGNGRLECDEECDDGNSDPTDACTNSCEAAHCGDGVIWAGVELCDSASVPSTCQDQGFPSGQMGCASDCLSLDSSQCKRWDGDPCTSDGQCDGGICFDEFVSGWPGGFCTRDCGSGGTPCAGPTSCIVAGIGPRCYERCATSSECRPGYLCRLDPFEGVQLVCRPLCENNSNCPDTGICNPWTGRCNSVANTSDGNNGAACGGTDPPYCKSEMCGTNLPNGYCFSYCNTMTGFCPGDGVCVATQAADGDLG
ncbi:MAG: DUF4215 domain-containing protein, partial [Polyangia bacterium]|nr:DUF4215 domain-containing protein [Polyangia bacterium]